MYSCSSSNLPVGRLARGGISSHGKAILVYLHLVYGDQKTSSLLHPARGRDPTRYACQRFQWLLPVSGFSHLYGVKVLFATEALSLGVDLPDTSLKLIVLWSC